MYPDYTKLRHVRFDGYTLETWETGKNAPTGQYLLRYRMCKPDGTALFEGDDYGCSPMDCIDSDASLIGLLGFLTCRPGDTDDEYFASYTPEQLEWAESEAEELQLWGMEPQDDDEGEPLQFEEVCK